ncbi:MAG: hypothetical protein HC796_10300 [Synechococcaceae cyanobacterium RL_1_2]|nr:hypothetical protein [Synechococcaceae cyanobacterium RL_1_2]
MSLLIITERKEEFDLLKLQLFLKEELIVGCLREEFRIAQLDRHNYWLVIVGGEVLVDLVAEIKGRGLPVIRWFGDNGAVKVESLKDGVDDDRGHDRDRLNHLILQGLLERSLPYVNWWQQQLESSTTLEELGDRCCDGLVPLLLDRPYLIRVVFNQTQSLFPRHQSLYPVFEELKCAGIDPGQNRMDNSVQFEVHDSAQEVNSSDLSPLGNLSRPIDHGGNNSQNLDSPYTIPLTWRAQNYGQIILFPRAIPPTQLWALLRLMEVMAKVLTNAIANLALEQK